MTKLLLRRVSLVLFVGILTFQTIRVFFPPRTPETATDVAAPINDRQLEEPPRSSARQEPSALTRFPGAKLSRGQLIDDQRKKGALANEGSSPSASRRPTEASKQEKPQFEQQRLLDEQAEQEAAYEDSLRSTSQPTANTDLTERERLQLEQQRLLDEQAEQEAAAYEESLRLTK